MEINELTSAIIGAAIEVHRRLGPGLLESAYRVCLAYELRKRGFDVVEEEPVPVIYDDVHLECGFCADLLVGPQSMSRMATIRQPIPACRWPTTSEQGFRSFLHDSASSPRGLPTSGIPRFTSARNLPRSQRAGKLLR